MSTKREAALKAFAQMLPTAREEQADIIDVNPDWGLDADGNLANHKTGKPGEEENARLRVAKPHCYASADASLEEKSFGAKPNVTARGQLFREVGAERYRAIQDAWGADDSLRPGKHPADAAAEAETSRANKIREHARNPFHANWAGGDRHAAIDSIIKNFGSAAASRMAHSAGVQLNLQPLRK